MERDGTSRVFGVSPTGRTVRDMLSDGGNSVPLVGPAAKEVIELADFTCVDNRTMTGNPDAGYQYEGPYEWRCRQTGVDGSFFINGANWLQEESVVLRLLIADLEKRSNRTDLIILLS